MKKTSVFLVMLASLFIALSMPMLKFANAEVLYTNVLLDNVDPTNHVYAHNAGGTSNAHGQITVSRLNVVDGTLRVRVLRHTDSNNAPQPCPRIGQDCPISMGPPIVVPTQIYENNDAHRVHLWVWCSDGDGGDEVSNGGGWGYVKLTYLSPTGVVTLTQSILSYSSPHDPGWGGWWFRLENEWFEFKFSGINAIGNITVDLYLAVANHMNGEYGLDGLIDVVINRPLPPSTVGGVAVSVDKLSLLAPYIGLCSTIAAATVATAILVKRGKHKKEKQ